MLSSYSGYPGGYSVSGSGRSSRSDHPLSRFKSRSSRAAKTKRRHRRRSSSLSYEEESQYSTTDILTLVVASITILACGLIFYGSYVGWSGDCFSFARSGTCVLQGNFGSCPVHGSGNPTCCKKFVANLLSSVGDDKDRKDSGRREKAKKNSENNNTILSEWLGTEGYNPYFESQRSEVKKVVKKAENEFSKWYGPLGQKGKDTAATRKIWEKSYDQHRSVRKVRFDPISTKKQGEMPYFAYNRHDEGTCAICNFVGTKDDHAAKKPDCEGWSGKLTNTRNFKCGVKFDEKPENYRSGDGTKHYKLVADNANYFKESQTLKTLPKKFPNSSPLKSCFGKKGTQTQQKAREKKIQSLSNTAFTRLVDSEKIKMPKAAVEKKPKPS